jgi:transcriptional regulator with XRE-family HTH domain
MQTIQGASPSATSEATRTQPPLVIHAGSHTYTCDESDAPIIIGRGSAAQVIVNDDSISRAHVRIDHTSDGWVAIGQNRNGIYVDGVQQAAVPIRDGMTIHLGDPQGTPVAFGHQTSPRQTKPGVADEDEDEDEDEEDTDQSSIPDPDPGIAHAGAAVAVRREELKLTQRHLARAGIVNAGALIAFEKGRRWPRTATRTKIEDALRWPHGHIVGLRREGNNADTQSAVDDSNTVRASLMTGAVEVALNTINAAIESLPETTDPAFSARASTILADLRRLESVASNAAQTTKGNSEVAVMLGEVRKCYKDLMLRASRATGATLGQRLYAARHRTELSVEETANAAGVPVEAIIATEAEVSLDEKTVTALWASLTVLTRRGQ